MSSYSVITPYIVPIGASKRVNVGDGFILDSAAKLIGAPPSYALSSWKALTAEDLDVINSTDFLVVVGANSLKDDFSIAPQFDMALFRKIKVPLFLFGLGHYGVSNATKGLTSQSKEMFAAIFDRAPYVSVRCEASRDYLLKSLPEFGERILVTSCPVVFPVDGIDRGFKKKNDYGEVVLTITDRCFISQQLPMFNQVKQVFSADRYTVAFHQDFGNSSLHEFARRSGFNVFVSDRYQDYLKLYSQCDVHFGNRVHAHLKCLSYGTLSYCAPFDLRQYYFSESLGFPLISSTDKAAVESYDFQEMICRRARYRLSLDKFVGTFPV